MENVVYILGAGFSAPLGLPVMGNFLMKSKDQRVYTGEKYSHFDQVFEMISELSVIKNYYNTDLFNIEEILSILEMRQALDHGSARASFARYISEVILHHTPPTEAEHPVDGWQTRLFGQRVWQPYGLFVARLFGQKLRSYADSLGSSTRFYRPEAVSGTGYTYGVVTLNYDTVLEQMAACASRSRHISWHFGASASRRSPDDRVTVPLAKLHGTVDGMDTIIPPTWNKGLSNGYIMSAWQTAMRLLSRATTYGSSAIPYQMVTLTFSTCLRLLSSRLTDSSQST